MARLLHPHYFTPPPVPRCGRVGEALNNAVSSIRGSHALRLITRIAAYNSRSRGTHTHIHVPIPSRSPQSHTNTHKHQCCRFCFTRFFARLLPCYAETAPQGRSGAILVATLRKVRNRQIFALFTQKRVALRAPRYGPAPPNDTTALRK
jgi:hypothetical protein